MTHVILIHASIDDIPVTVLHNATIEQVRAIAKTMLDEIEAELEPSWLTHAIKIMGRDTSEILDSIGIATYGEDGTMTSYEVIT